MSGFLSLTPVVEVVIENPFLGIAYPRKGSLVAIVDTGYEGFLAVPQRVFENTALSKLRTQKRILRLADGSPLPCVGAYGTVHMAGRRVKMDGFIETFSGLEEVVIGVEGLVKVKLLLDYCLMRTKVERCP